MLSLFVIHFNYTVDSFDRLTLSQAFLILDQYEEKKLSELNFIRSELRIINFYNVKSSMAETKDIRKPKDLYEIEEIDNAPIQLTKEQLDFINEPIPDFKD